MQDFHKAFTLAKNVVQKAGTIILPYFDINPGIIKKKAEDLSWVTEADGKSEDFIRKELFKEFPEFGFIGEEGKEDIKEISWIVDPLDGTTPFARGIPEFGVVVALKVENSTVFSVIYFPLSKTLLSAYVNEGTYEWNKRLSVSNTATLEDAIISTRRSFNSEPFKSYVVNLASDYRFRIGMSSAVESYYLASGRLDVSARFYQHIWDVAPECLIMQEAGAIVTDVYGKPLQLTYTKEAKHSYIATNPLLSKKYKSVLYLSDK